MIVMKVVVVVDVSDDGRRQIKVCDGGGGDREMEINLNFGFLCATL